MRPPDGPPGPNESDWAQVIQIELNSWDPRLLSPRFQPRRRQRAIPVLRPLPLALVALVAVTLAATVLAGGPRALTMAIVHLASGRPQPTATPAPPAPHRAGAGMAPSVFAPGPGSISGGPLGTPTPAQGNPDAQPGGSAAAAGGGAPTQGGAPGSAGAGQTPAAVGQEQPPPPSQHQGAPIPNVPSDSQPTLPTLPTLPPVHVMPPAHPTLAPATPSPPTAVPGAGIGRPLPQPTQN
jgi:hypothetical protein